MEITIISAQGLKPPSFFPHHLKPFIILTTTPPSSAHDRDVYATAVDHAGGVNPTWGDKFDFSKAVHAGFFRCKYSCIYVQVYTNCFLLGRRFVGWCGIPVRDIVDGFSQAGTVRYLSYRLRKKDGSKGCGVVNVMVKLESSVVFQTSLPEMNYGRVAIGIPVKSLRVVNDIKNTSVKTGSIARSL